MILFCLLASFAYFIPPDGWECAAPKKNTPYVQVSFFTQSASPHRPSINLSTEPVDVPLKKYVQEVKTLHKENPNFLSCKNLGKITCKQAEGRLLEITTRTPAGTLKLLQALFVEKNMAYILTGAFHPEDLTLAQKPILKTFGSFELLSSPLDLLSKEEGKELQATLDSLDKLPSKERPQAFQKLQKQVLAHAQLGAQWQFHLLKEGYQRINP